jgi:hypothetical protein
MGRLKKYLRKIIPREIRDNPLVAVVAVVALGPAALGVIGASTASLVGATVAAQTATAVALGTGVVTAGITFAQTGDVSEALKSGVRAGAGSFVGSQVSSSITNAVAAETGASLADLEPALRELPSQAGIGQSLAGAVSITAGNVAGNAARSVVMGRPIEEGAFAGLTQSVPEFASISNDVNRLNPIVRDVLASSAQAALTGQDIGDAALAALVRSTQIVSRAINEIPGGQEFMKERPILTKYVVDTVSSALAAELQGKDVSESVINRLVQTTAQVIGEQIENADNANKVNETQQKYNAAVAKEEEIADLSNKIEGLYTKYATSIDQYNFVAATSDYFLGMTEHYLRLAENEFYDIPSREEYARQANEFYDKYVQHQDEVKDANRRYLKGSGFDGELNELNNQILIASDELRTLTNELQADISQLVQYSAGLFTDFETDIATALSPLTAFDDEFVDVTDQDVMAEIQPVTLPTEVTNIADITPQPLPADLQTDLAQSLPSVANQIASLQTPNLTFADVDSTVKTYFDAYKSFLNAANANVDEESKQSFINAANLYLNLAKNREQEILNGSPINFIQPPGEQTPVDVAETPSLVTEFPQEDLVAEGPVTDQEIAQEMQGGGQLPTDIGVEIAGPVSPDILGRLQSMPLTGEQVVREQFTDDPDPDIGGLLRRTIQGTRNDGSTYFYTINTFEDGTVIYSAVIDGEAQVFETRPDLKNSTPGIGDVPEGEGTAGTGTPGAPPVDFGQDAPVEIVDPSYSVLFDLRDYGPGSPLSPNLAVFEIGGGRGTPGGSSTETTFNLVSRDQGTGQETYDVGGKQYALVVLPDKQVLVPKDPSEVVVYLERDPVTNLPKMKEVPVSTVPPQEAQQIAEKVGQTAGGTPAGAEGVSGGRTGESQTTTTEEQLQPGVRPEEVTSGVVSEEAAPSFPDVISGITEPTIPASVPGQAAGTETGAQPPGAGGIGDEITDEDIIRLIQGELGTSGGGGEGEEELGGGEGEGQGTGEGEGTGTGTAGEGTGTGAGGEGTGTGRGGEGTGTGTGTGPGTGEGGGQVQKPTEIVLPTPSITTVPRRTFRRPGDAPPYRVTGMDESGILGRKQPLFGGDEDLQRAEWNRRSLRLKRLLGL